MIQRIHQISLIWFLGFLIALLSVSTVQSQFSMGATSMSMGQTGVAVPDQSWSLFSNSALLQTDGNSVSFYGFQYVGISEITDVAATGIYQTSFGTFGAGLHRYGFNLFNENRIRIAYKNNLGNFHYGTVVNYNHVFQGADYGSAGAFGIDVGLATQLLPDFWFGARATNINQPTYGSSDEELPRDLAVGISYRLSGSTLFTSEIVKDIRFPLSFRGGVEFEVIDNLFARSGISNNPQTYSAGFGYQTHRIHVNIAVQQHIPLGLSPGIDLGIKF